MLYCFILTQKNESERSEHMNYLKNQNKVTRLWYVLLHQGKRT